MNDNKTPYIDSVYSPDENKNITHCNHRASKGMTSGEKVAVGAGMGVFLGVVGGVAAAYAGNTSEPDPLPKAVPEDPKPEWLVGELEVAGSVNDSMSFNQAFAAARAELGAGGVFEWRGGVYGTYYATEWNSMSAAEKAEWNHNFSWGKFHATPGSLAETHVHDNNNLTNVIDEPGESNLSHIGDGPAHVIKNPGLLNGDDIEVLAVVHDKTGDGNLGMLRIDGQEVYVMDLDNDTKFELMAYDADHDGNFSEGEFVDISDHNLTVSSLGGYGVSDEILANKSMQPSAEVMHATDPSEAGEQAFVAEAHPSTEGHEDIIYNFSEDQGLQEDPGIDESAKGYHDSSDMNYEEPLSQDYDVAHNDLQDGLDISTIDSHEDILGLTPGEGDIIDDNSILI